MEKISDLNVILALYGIPGVIAIEKLFSMGINPEQINIFTHKKDVRNLPLWNYAKSNGIRIVDYQVNSKDLYLWVKEKNPSALFSLHYRDRIPLKIIELTKYGGVNLHPSLLPDYRGCFSIPWAIINGEKRTGYTYHYMIEEFDKGNIIFQKSVIINKNDTAFSLFHKLIIQSLNSFETVFRKVVFANYKGQKQPKKGSYFPREVPYGGYIDLAWDRERIKRFIRAMSFPPYKGAILKFNSDGHEVKTYSEFLTLKTKYSF
jgi:methionyl-tRNA formyltransferase